MKRLLSILALALFATACNGGGARTNDQLVWSGNPPGDDFEFRHNHDVIPGVGPAAWLEFVSRNGEDTMTIDRDVEITLVTVYTTEPDGTGEVVGTETRTVTKIGRSWDDGEFLTVVGSLAPAGSYAHTYESEAEFRHIAGYDIEDWWIMRCEYHDPDGSNPDPTWTTVEVVECKGRTADHTGQG